MSDAPEHPNDTTREKIEQLAAAGLNPSEVGQYLGISLAIIGEHYSDEMESAPLRATAAIAQRVYAKAMSSDDDWMTAAQFWLKESAWKKKEPKR